MLFEQKDYLMTCTLFVWKDVLVNSKTAQYKGESTLLIKFCVKFWYIVLFKDLLIFFYMHWI